MVMNIICIILFIFIIYFIVSNICKYLKVEKYGNMDFLEEEFNLDAKVLYSQQTPYNLIDILEYQPNKHGFNKCLFLNEELQFCDGKEYKYHEIIAHYPSSYLSKIENVLIVGGGDCMTLREIVKYPDLKKVKMLEIDNEVINVSKKYFKTSSYENDPRVEIIIGDASKTIKKQENGKYDLIIIDTTEMGEPNTVIDSLSFFKDCKRCLKNNGILVKNGENIKNFSNLDKIFKYKKLFKTNYNIFGLYYDGANEYIFMMFSDTDFTKRKCHKINKLKYYDCKKHNNFSYN